MSEFLDVAEVVFLSAKRPMRAKQIVDYARENGLFSDRIAGKTPHQTMKAKLSVDIRRKGEQSRFVRTAPGRFYLRALIVVDDELYHARPLLPPRESERVLVFPSGILDRLGRFQGVRRSWRRIAKDLFRHPLKYVDRLYAERDDENKQVLTYVMVRRSGLVLAYKRGTFNRVEEFLRGCHCIGFGGHVSEADLDLFSRDDYGISRCAARELGEELTLPDEDVMRLDRGEGLKLVGVLNDDSSPVGRRHFAFVFEYWVGDHPFWSAPKRGEKSITQLRWLDTTAPDFSLWSFEYWSQLCLREYFAPGVLARPAFIVRRKLPLRPPSILIVLGPAGSGKSEATGILKEDFGYSEINSGKVLARLLDVPPVPETPRVEFQRIAWEFIRKPGSRRLLAEALWREASNSSNTRVLVDGIRQCDTIENLRRIAQPRRIGLLYVHTPPDMAFEFFKSRQSGLVDIYDFLALRDAPVEQEVQAMIGQCDALLYNWVGKPQYRQVVHKLMRELGVEPV